MRVPHVAHVPFAVVLAAAIWIRIIAVLAYPAPLWFGDSPGYLEAAIRLRPGETRPSGYPFLLWLIEPLHSFTAVVAVQHAIGLLSGVLVYAVVLRAGRAARPPDEPGRWSWRVWAPTWWLGAIAGTFTAFAALTRSAGLPLIAVILVAMLLRQAGWRACVAAVVMFVLPVVGYMAWFQAVYGQFKLAKADSIWLYGRTASFADCRVIDPRPELRIMCPQRTDSRMSRPFAAMWTKDSAFREIPGWVTGEQANRLAGEFALEAIEKQPGDYAKVVVHDTFMAFEWNRRPYPTPWTWLQYEFPEGEAWSDEQALLAAKYDPDGGETRVVRPWAGQVLAYQDHFAMPGTFLGILLIGGLAGPFLHVRARGRWRPLRPVRHWGTGALLPWGTSLALLVIPAATADFDYRYVLPAVPFACMALGLATLPPPRRPRPTVVDGKDDADPRRGHERPEPAGSKTRSTARDAALPSSSGQNRSTKASYRDL
ncbi:hypothetical protein [Actinomadura bangladeshensis]|uniref:Glycosyltransferase RgtA/B/C/D-like domain-containing protein n=1 Tax=Actinomadura bangladeshensis TaxID=453573 RepID=A0A4R4P7W8_9ACTN|nr:hypothetical protein [Actinomadura bangladeshensis]TDC17894.1 hypothetical protein E1284_07890 [Actinomadura bangladeshensis]